MPPLWYCALFKPCAPPATGELIVVLVGLLWAVTIWLALFLGIGMGRR